ncbi:hypothetical protein Ddye_029972 [Dipteronia dyeriana]|uniref:Uncharacterized protein n=1 Tax=Dipteronia dyeriana TaxID=168575 RepID=A0AAD9TFE9_9ROSI|nr:hypothetical protein Ddye_029972 [Dipteronia dyeriana]
MNQCAIQQNMVASGREEIRNSVPVSVSDVRRDKDYLVCPKPRRLGLLNAAAINDPQPLRPLRWNLSHQAENFDSKAGSDLFDIILPKGGYGGHGTEQSCTQLASSPPFFCGSPPSRVANPVIHDSRFGDEKITSLSTLPPIPLPSSPSSSSRKGGGGGVVGGGSGGSCVRPNFGNKPAVRIEGFDCLDRDLRNCSSIPALA